jgi:hypothetical protein
MQLEHHLAVMPWKLPENLWRNMGFMWFYIGSIVQYKIDVDLCRWRWDLCSFTWVYVYRYSYTSWVLHRKTDDTMVEPSKRNIADESKKEWRTQPMNDGQTRPLDNQEWKFWTRMFRTWTKSGNRDPQTHKSICFRPRNPSIVPQSLGCVIRHLPDSS